MSEWISVKDKLPKHEQTVLARTHKGDGKTIFLDGDQVRKKLKLFGFQGTDNEPYYFCNPITKCHQLNGVTHWMPLPESPK